MLGVGHFTTISVHFFDSYINTLQTQTLYNSQGTPCEPIPTGKNLFSLQGFPCKPLYFPVRDCSVPFSNIISDLQFTLCFQRARVLVHTYQQSACAHCACYPPLSIHYSSFFNTSTNLFTNLDLFHLYSKVLFIYRCSKNWQKKKCVQSFVNK